MVLIWRLVSSLKDFHHQQWVKFEEGHRERFRLYRSSGLDSPSEKPTATIYHPQSRLTSWRRFSVPYSHPQNFFRDDDSDIWFRKQTHHDPHPPRKEQKIMDDIQSNAAVYGELCKYTWQRRSPSQWVLRYVVGHPNWGYVHSLRKLRLSHVHLQDEDKSIHIRRSSGQISRETNKPIIGSVACLTFGILRLTWNICLTEESMEINAQGCVLTLLTHQPSLDRSARWPEFVCREEKRSEEGLKLPSNSMMRMGANHFGHYFSTFDNLTSDVGIEWIDGWVAAIR